MSFKDWFSIKHFDEQTEEERLNEEHADDPYWSAEDSLEDNLWIGPLAKRRDEECAADSTPFGRGQAHARFDIDDKRRYWHQTGASSFREYIEVSGKYWHKIVQEEEELVAQGYTDRQEKLDFARGIRSMYD